MHAPLSFADVEPTSWQAHLILGFVDDNGKTILKSRRHSGPLLVQRPFYPEGGVCHVYLLHPPGGVVGGDSLDIEVDVGTDCHVLLTTPAAGKFYRSDGRIARQTVHMRVAQNGILEWLPQETLVFDQARLVATNQIDLELGACFMAWDVLAFGRPAAGEKFESGQTHWRWRINLEGRPLLNEHWMMDELAFRQRWGLAGMAACGSLLAYPVGRAELEWVQQLLSEQPGYGVTLIDNLLICRGMEQRADRISACFRQIWQVLRAAMWQRTAVHPRIWAT